MSTVNKVKVVVQPETFVVDGNTIMPPFFTVEVEEGKNAVQAVVDHMNMRTPYRFGRNTVVTLHPDFHKTHKPTVSLCVDRGKPTERNEIVPPTESWGRNYDNSSPLYTTIYYSAKKLGWDVSSVTCDRRWVEPGLSDVKFYPNSHYATPAPAAADPTAVKVKDAAFRRQLDGFIGWAETHSRSIGNVFTPGGAAYSCAGYLITKVGDFIAEPTVERANEVVRVALAMRQWVEQQAAVAKK